jgi:Ca-activated chloride channel family protein
MSRVLACATLVITLSFDGHAQQQPPAFTGTSELVRIYATVTDRDGRLVTTLTRDAFEIRDEGKPQPIAQFDSTPQPIRVIVMLDVSGSMEGNLSLLRTACDALFARLRSDDRVKVGTFGAEIRISEQFTKDLSEIRAALPRSIQPDAPTPLWRGIDEAIGAFSDTDDTRRVILVLSDGKDTGPISFRERPHSQSEVIDHARSKDVMIYGVAMRSRSRASSSPGLGPGGLQAMINAELPDPGLARVAEETGGGYLEIRLGQDLGPAFAGVADELHTQYLLGYEPPRRDGKVHDVTVKVNQNGLKPRARKNYVAPKG